MTKEAAARLVDKMTQDEATTMFHALKNKFGWQGTVFQRGDVESHLDRDLTEEEWGKVQDAYEWHKGVPDRCTEAGWAVIQELCDELGLKGPYDGDEDEDEEDEEDE